MLLPKSLNSLQLRLPGELTWISHPRLLHDGWRSWTRRNVFMDPAYLPQIKDAEPLECMLRA